MQKENCRQARFTQQLVCIWYDPWDGEKWCQQFQGNYIQLSHSLHLPPRCCLQHQPCGFTLDLEECWGRNRGVRGLLGRALKKQGSFQETPEEEVAVCQESASISGSWPAHCQTAYRYLFVSCFLFISAYSLSPQDESPQRSAGLSNKKQLEIHHAIIKHYNPNQ